MGLNKFFALPESKQLKTGITFLRLKAEAENVGICPESLLNQLINSRSTNGVITLVCKEDRSMFEDIQVDQWGLSYSLTSPVMRSDK